MEVMDTLFRVRDYANLETAYDAACNRHDAIVVLYGAASINNIRGRSGKIIAFRVNRIK